MIGLGFLSVERECFYHGNLNIYDMYWSSERELLTLSNKLFNPNPLSKQESSAPWAGDLADFACVLVKLLAQDEDIDLKTDNSLNSPLDLFKRINKKVKFPRVPKNSVPLSPSRPLSQNTLIIIQSSFLELRQEAAVELNIDLDLGVPLGFNPEDENFDELTLNEKLRDSIYNLIFRLMGRYFRTTIRYKQFDSPAQVLEHPFIYQVVDPKSLPSDVK